MEEKKLYLPYLFSALSRASFEGNIALIEGDIQRTIYFRGGKVVNVASQLQEETLGRCLLDEGKITQEAYNKLLEQMLKTHQPAGQLLISMGALNPPEIFQALERQVRRKLLNCFKMVDFGFNLEPGTVPPEELIVNIDLTEVFFTGILEAYSVDRLLTEFPVDEETQFTIRPMPRDRTIRIGPKEHKIYRLFIQGGTMSKLMKASEDLTQTLSALYALHALYLLDSAEIERPDTVDLDLPGLVENDPATPAAPRPAEGSSAATPAAPRPAEGSSAAPSLPAAPLAADSSSLAMGPEGLGGLLAKKVVTLTHSDHFVVLEINPLLKGMELKNSFFRIIRTYRLQDIDECYASEDERQMARTLLDRATMAFRELSGEESRKAYVEALRAKQDLKARQIPPRLLADVEAQKGELALSVKHFAEAEQLYQKAISLYADEPTYHFQLGLVCYKKALEETPADQPLPETVRKPFLKALSIKPSYDQSRLYLGYIAKRNGDLKTALKEFKAAAESNPHNTLAQSEVRLLSKRVK